MTTDRDPEVVRPTRGNSRPPSITVPNVIGHADAGKDVTQRSA
jgi:hypothetical protein